ncbi:SRPBCC domain-containing protein [Mesorhizobium sp. CA18]|uniref:SRPBCC family protein n=1 Tax=unclassified Mesorhizobium TaxID=325217 RepID=UPI001CC9D9A9|nr:MULTISPECIES: SRPBCC domain-containing protein [unclassified Mesorhizobium]MBZ9736830.1 SRPBCC domain-containing protein [Mesorhizobium sp. CA9]MBZ9828376.1 SRPBCC domain-containing protein [Mesorhizobium sp. CA18]MBZ9834237.1 SRPBCC domain-containing protein [Mesorhizobium sp. CA2]MBZ9840333.1 SRPBCC domain-containing protein [Mesorhizobium sp. CA3]MBZ9879032.1 SRPBCC domain-containing protein [Mesorhizobium sp. Ca11]
MTKAGKPTATDAALNFECELPEPPEKVWRALTEPELLAAWMMPNDMKAEAGARFAFAGPDESIECEVIEAEPGKLLRYSWHQRPNANDRDRFPAFDSIVTFTLTRTASGGTHLSIVHDGFVPVAEPVLAIAGAGCGLSLHARKNPIAANAPCMMLRAA